jgi:hypothetical protein
MLQRSIKSVSWHCILIVWSTVNLRCRIGLRSCVGLRNVNVLFLVIVVHFGGDVGMRGGIGWRRVRRSSVGLGRSRVRRSGVGLGRSRVSRSRVRWSSVGFGRNRVRRSGVGLCWSSIGRSRVRWSSIGRSGVGLDRSRISRSGIVVLADDNVGQVSVVVGDVVDGMNGSIGHASVPVTDLLARFHVLLTTLLVAVVVIDGVVVVDDLGLQARTELVEKIYLNKRKSTKLATYHILNVV